VKTARLLKEMANSELFAASSLNTNKFRVNKFEKNRHKAARGNSTYGVNIMWALTHAKINIHSSVN